VLAHKTQINRACLVTAVNMLVSETNKGKRSESFSQALAVFFARFCIQHTNYMQIGKRVKPFK
jgi:hypothetical protein